VKHPLTSSLIWLQYRFFSKLDDETVCAWFQKYDSVVETAELYFKWKSKSEEDIDFEEYYKEVIEPTQVTCAVLDLHPVIFNRQTQSDSDDDI